MLHIIFITFTNAILCSRSFKRRHQPWRFLHARFRSVKLRLDNRFRLVWDVRSGFWSRWIWCMFGRKFEPWFSFRVTIDQNESVGFCFKDNWKPRNSAFTVHVSARRNRICWRDIVAWVANIVTYMLFNAKNRRIKDWKQVRLQILKILPSLWLHQYSLLIPS